MVRLDVNRKIAGSRLVILPRPLSNYLKSNVELKTPGKQNPLRSFSYTGQFNDVGIIAFLACTMALLATQAPPFRPQKHIRGINDGLVYGHGKRIRIMPLYGAIHLLLFKFLRVYFPVHSSTHVLQLVLPVSALTPFSGILTSGDSAFTPRACA